MRTFFFRNPNWFRSLWPDDVIWTIPTDKQAIYLTFDDGPSRQVTEYVVDTLKEYSAKATFFCVGKRAIQSPDVLQLLEKEGHLIGNHTFSHQKTDFISSQSYVEDIEKCRQSHDYLSNSPFFRPPYGRLPLGSMAKIRAMNLQIVMWSFMSGDFLPNLNIEKSIDRMKRATSGDVMLFHDSPKAFHNLKILLPAILRHFSDLGYEFKTLKSV